MADTAPSGVTPSAVPAAPGPAQFWKGAWLWSPDPSLKLASALAIATSGIVLYMAVLGTLTAMLLRALVLSLLVAIVFLVFPLRLRAVPGRLARALDLTGAALALLGYVYLAAEFDTILSRQGLPLRPADLVVGGIYILLVLEMARRAAGLALMLFGVAFLVYAWSGPLLPGLLGHRGYHLDRILSNQFFSLQGLFSIPLGVYVSIIVVYVLFGAFVEATRGEQFFSKVALAATGRMVGGPGIAAVVASALMGTISGSPTGNVVTIGTFTIPLMRRIGFRSLFAAAVEATASTGGQIMPPVMGAAAFIMAELLGIPYATVMRVALVPAILYFLSIGVAVRFHAMREGLNPLPASEVAGFVSAVREGAHLLLPVGVLLYLLAVEQSSPAYAGFWALLALVAVSFARASSRLDWRDVLAALERGVRQSLSIGASCAIAGVILGVITMTGLGVRLSILVVELSGGMLIVALVLTATTSMLLGLGMPTSAAYILLASLVGGALAQMHVPVLAAHMFILYFGALSAITPPDAPAAFAAAGFTGDSPWAVGWESMRLSIAAFLIPFMFVFNPSLLLEGSPEHILLAAAGAVLGVIALAAALQRWFLGPIGRAGQVVLLGVALALVYPRWFSAGIGAAALLGLAIYRRWHHRMPVRVTG